MYTYTSINTHLSLHVSIYACTMYMYTYVCTYMYTYVYIYIYIYIYIHIHTYICSGILVLETVAKSEVFQNDALVQEHFGDMASAMFTLFQFMTFDSWNVVARRVTDAMPEAHIV